MKQNPVSVRAFSSEYGASYSNSQVMKNVCGKPGDSSSFGDNQYAAAFSTYGKWAERVPSNKAYPRQLGTPPWFTATDFLECSFGTPVIAHSITLCQNFFPGSLCRILGTHHGLELCNNPKWHTLWSKDDLPEKGKVCDVYEYSVFKTNLWKTSEPVDVVRLEFDFQKNEYFSQIEIIELVGEICTPGDGSCPLEIDHDDRVEEDLEDCVLFPVCVNENDETFQTGTLYIDLLPSEILLKVLGFLAIDDLFRISRVNKLLHHLSQDTSLYVTMNMRPFYPLIVDQSLLYLAEKFTDIQSLELSWLGANNQLSTSSLCDLLRKTPNLIELRMSSCPMLASSVLETLAIYCSNLEMLDISYSNNGLQLSLSWLTTLKKLKFLDITHSLVLSSELLLLLKKLDSLEWLMLGSPALIADQNRIIEMLTQKSSRKLKGINLWYWDKLSFNSMTSFLVAFGRTLVEVNMGWCTSVATSDVLPVLGGTCPNLLLLALTAHHETTDTGLETFSQGCPLIEQLDLLGSRHISVSGLQTLLTSCPKLVSLDVSYCRRVSVEDIDELKKVFPTTSIKHVESYITRSLI